MIENLKCPECGGPMVSRANNKTGQRFWGCRAFPDCTGTRDTDGESNADYRRDEDVSELPSSRRRENDRGRWRQ